MTILASKVPLSVDIRNLSTFESSASRWRDAGQTMGHAEGHISAIFAPIGFIFDMWLAIGHRILSCKGHVRTCPSCWTALF